MRERKTHKTSTFPTHHLTRLAFFHFSHSSDAMRSDLRFALSLPNFATLMTTKLSALFVAYSLAALASGKEIITREIPWDGSEALTIAVPADVRFVQAPGPGKVLVSGPRRSVESFKVSGGVLRDGTLRTGKPLTIVVTAPKITRFAAQGSTKLTIEGFDQDELQLETTGRADVKAAGRAGTIKLNLQGFGWADLSQVQAQGAEIALTGSRRALVAPQVWAKLSGNGVVVLLTRPTQLDLELWGAGRVFHAGPLQPALAHAGRLAPITDY